MKNGGLKSDMVAISMLFVFAISIFPGFILTYNYSRNLTQNKINMGLAIARGTSGLLSRSDSWKQINWKNLAHDVKSVDFKLMLVSDARGRILYKDAETSASQTSLLRGVLIEGQEQIHIERDSLWNGNGTFTVAVPLSSNNFLAGAILFSGHMESVFKAEHETFFWLGLFILINTLLVIIFIIVFLNRRLLHPLKELARDFESLSRDAFVPHARPSFSKEVQELFEAFDRAAVELSEGRDRLKQQLQTIAHTQKQLHRSEKMAAVGRLASGLAHELGNPIGALIGFIRLLQDEAIDPDSKTMILEQSTCELMRMDKSIKELLQFSRPSRPDPEPTDITAVAQSALALTKPQKWSFGVDFTLRTESDYMVMGERNLLLQVFLNLLANACQAFTAGQADNKKVSISIEQSSSHEICVSIEDNGPGVIPEDVPHLFEPYFTRKEPGSGTGLGLAISMATINDFGGHMEYKTAEAGGAIFCFFLPLATEGESR